MIGESASRRCALESIDIPSSDEEIGDRAYANSNVKSVVFSPDSKLRKIGKKKRFKGVLWKQSTFLPLSRLLGSYVRKLCSVEIRVSASRFKAANNPNAFPDVTA